MSNSRLVLLVQLPIPPPGAEVVEGNVPLAAAYLKLYADRQGLSKSYHIELLPPRLVNTLGDQGLVEEILARRPWMVGFTCYVWNVERTLWIAQQLKQWQPELKTMLGGPEITADNAWVLGQATIDYAVLGEGEQTFAELLVLPNTAYGVYGLQSSRCKPLSDLDTISSPYLEGILDVADERRGRCWRLHGVAASAASTATTLRTRMSSLSLSRSDRGQSASCGRIRSYGGGPVGPNAQSTPRLRRLPSFAGREQLTATTGLFRRVAGRRHRRKHGPAAARGQLPRGRDRPAIGRAAGVGVDRPTDESGGLRSRAASTTMLAEGIKVHVDMILGLPGDTVDSVRCGIDFLQRTQTYSEVQVFNLSILPGTPFRQEAGQLGLTYQPWPPYYVLKTPTLDVEQMYRLMEESQEAFGIEFDPLPRPRLDLVDRQTGPCRGCRIDLDALESERTPCGPETTVGKPVRYTGATVDYPKTPAVGFVLWLCSADFHQKRKEAAALIDRLLTDNPYTTLQVIFEPTADPDRLTVETLNLLLATCYKTPTYLDRYYSLHPGRLLGAKRLFVWLPQELSADSVDAWCRHVTNYATILRPRHEQE